MTLNENKNPADILKKYAKGDFQYGCFKCEIDGYDNEGYRSGGIPKRLYFDIAKKEKCCFIFAHFSGYCPDCINSYKEQCKREKK
ncbi:hypothetical protein FACS189447_07560 [Spirochaetia bacterium]|nr:hypothetical protein FACS189447_07560 [Spirochaetia bacterium]